jgi:hypothetical protein
MSRCFVRRRTVIATTVLVMGLLNVLSHRVSQAANPPALALLLTDDNSFLDDTGGTVVVRVYYASGTYAGAAGAMFRIRASAGFTGVLVSEEYPFGSIWAGNVTDGLILTLPHVLCDGIRGFNIVTMTFQLSGTSAPCSYLEVLAHPDAATPLVARCDLVLVEPLVDELWVNYDHYNGCPPPVATEQTTWGRVKALYRN